jgi:hypothetical protein
MRSIVPVPAPRVIVFAVAKFVPVGLVNSVWPRCLGVFVDQAAVDPTSLDRPPRLFEHAARLPAGSGAVRPPRLGVGVFSGLTVQLDHADPDAVGGVAENDLE